ncbi:unnamed protein product [Dicrocoelium dendriticum]|nr:unnamed protein product [Dicrocoelium dendriticum]
MPSASVANFENEDLLSSRLLSFMANNDTVSIGYDGSGYNNGTKFVPSTGFGSPGGSFENSDAVGSHNLRSPLHRNGSTPAMISLQDRVINGSTSDAFFPSHSTGFISGSCTPPPTVHPVSSVSTNFLPIRNQHGAPPYSALTSPCLGSKLNPGSGVTQLLSYSNSVAPNECHSLQNSPFYNHYPINGMQAQLHRQLGGISPNPIGTLLPNGVGGLGPAQNRTGLYQDGNFSLSGNLRSLNLGNSNSNCPQRELFPTSHQSGAQSIFGSGLLIQDRLHYYSLAQKQGYIVGAELERVKENSCRSTSQSYGRIAAHFRHRYGETEAKTKAAYLQIGVRVPSKDHVSEIVGKGGKFLFRR